jgi:hypothetical protein
MERRAFIQLVIAAVAGGIGIRKVTGQPPMPQARQRTNLSPGELDFFNFLEGFHAQRGGDIGQELADVRDGFEDPLSKDKAFIDRLYTEHRRRRLA